MWAVPTHLVLKVLFEKVKGKKKKGGGGLASVIRYTDSGHVGGLCLTVTIIPSTGAIVGS